MKDKDKNEKKDKIYYIIFGVIVCIALTIIAFAMLTQKPDEENPKEISYTELITKIDENAVEKIEMTVGSTAIKVKLKNEEEEKNAIVPSTQAFIELVQQKVQEGNVIDLKQKKTNILVRISDTLFSLLPTIMIVGLFIFVLKMQGLGDKGKVYDAESEKTNITFKDVAGLDEEKNELIEIVNFLKEPQKFQDMGAKIPRGILLYGKPGTGKTLIAKAIAGEAKVPFISMSGSEFIEMFAGLGASRARRTGGSGAESENNQTLNQLLVEMDGFDTDETVIVLAATNRPEMLDKALLRPGRFDRQITIAVPDARGREEILKIHSANKPLGDDIDLKDIATDTAGFTGAELANVLNEAAIIATTRNHEKIVMDDLEEAVKKVTVGLQKNSRVISEKDRKLTAYHEAGHAIVSKYLETQQDVKEISIIPRGLAGGYTMYKTNEDKYYISKTEMEEKLIALLGGRAAEKIALDDISTGASNDIEVATQIAKDMVKKYGMSDRVGPINLEAKEQYELQVFGNNIEDVIGVEVKTLIDTAYVKAQELILAHMDKLHAVAQKLLEKETITSAEFQEIFNK